MIAQIRKALKWLIKGYFRNICWNIYGKTIRNPFFSKAPESYLFICKGNICRSPFAEHITWINTGSSSKRNNTFHSAGLIVKKPIPSPKDAVIAAESFGVKLTSHRSKEITPEMIDAYDIIIAMETWQLNSLRKGFPNFQEKFFLLPLFDTVVSPETTGFYRYNIKDPYGRGLDEFTKCFQRIERCVLVLFEEIENIRIL